MQPVAVDPGPVEQRSPVRVQVAQSMKGTFSSQPLQPLPMPFGPRL